MQKQLGEVLDFTKTLPTLYHDPHSVLLVAHLILFGFSW